VARRLYGRSTRVQQYIDFVGDVPGAAPVSRSCHRSPQLTQQRRPWKRQPETTAIGFGGNIPLPPPLPVRCDALEACSAAHGGAGGFLRRTTLPAHGFEAESLLRGQPTRTVRCAFCGSSGPSTARVGGDRQSSLSFSRKFCSEGVRAWLRALKRVIMAIFSVSPVRKDRTAWQTMAESGEERVPRGATYFSRDGARLNARDGESRKGKRLNDAETWVATY